MALIIEVIFISMVFCIVTNSDHFRIHSIPKKIFLISGEVSNFYPNHVGPI
jgi:hypothetical protein